MARMQLQADHGALTYVTALRIMSAHACCESEACVSSTGVYLWDRCRLLRLRSADTVSGPPHAHPLALLQQFYVPGCHVIGALPRLELDEGPDRVVAGSDLARAVVKLCKKTTGD